MTRTFEFEGVPSGDGECFVWRMDAATFERLTGSPPGEYDRPSHGSGLYAVYPDTLHKGMTRKRCRIHVRIEVTE